MTFLYVGIFGLLGVFSRYFIGIIFKKFLILSSLSFPEKTIDFNSNFLNFFSNVNIKEIG